MREHVRENFVKRQSFQRHVRSLHRSVGNVGMSVSAQPLLPLASNHVVGTAASLSCGSMNLFPDDHRSVYSTGRTVSRLRDFDDFVMDSPYSGRRPSTHTAYVSQPLSPGSMESSPRRVGYGEHQHLPNFHHDHLHHQEHDQLGVNTLQPNTQRRERAREALIRRNLGDFNTSIDSAATTSMSSRTEMKTELTVVPNSVAVATTKATTPLQLPGNNNSNTGTAERKAKSHSNQSLQSEDSGDHMSSEDNLSHESYDLLDKEEEAQMNTFSENVKTVLSRSELSFDNSLSYAMPLSVPHTPNRPQKDENNFNLEADANGCQSLHEGNFTLSLNGKPKMNNANSTHSSRLSINSSGLSTSPGPESARLQEPVDLSQRRSSAASQKSKSSKGSKSNSGSRRGSHISLKETGHQSEAQESFHEIHIDGNLQQSPNNPYLSRPNQKVVDVNRNPGGLGVPKVRDDSRDSGMHENIIFQSPTNIKYFSSHIQSYSSRTLPGKKRREKSPVIFTRGKLSVECSSNSSSSHASPRISRPKSLDFSVVALHDLPRPNAYSYRDDTIDQPDFEDSSSALSVQNEFNYGSSSDVPPTPEMPEHPHFIGSGKHYILSKPNNLFYHNKPLNNANIVYKEERIYDIPEGIERDDTFDLSSPLPQISEVRQSQQQKYQIDHTKFKTYLEISGKFSSEDSESASQHQRPVFKVLPPPRMIKKVSSTESESAPSNNSVPPAVQFDSDTLSLPLDLLSPPMESESSPGIVDSESLPAPPQFGSSNKDDTDFEDEQTPKIDDYTPDSLDLVSGSNTIKKNKNANVDAKKETWSKQPTKQESTYESRAEAVLESQTTVESFAGDVPPPPEESEDNCQIIEEKLKSRRRESALLRALDTFDSFNQEHEFPITRRQESTYEDRADAMLEKQTTVESFTSQTSVDNDNVFIDQVPPEFDNEHPRRDTVLESQSTFESFTTECEVVVTKRQESTYEERAEHLLESQNTIDSFTNDVPNEDPESPGETEDHTAETEKILSDSRKTSDAKQLLSNSCQDEEMIAEMFVRQIASNESVSTVTNGESDHDSMPYIDESQNGTIPVDEDGLNQQEDEDGVFDEVGAVPPPDFIPTRCRVAGCHEPALINSMFIPPPIASDDLTMDDDFPTGPYDIIDPPPPLPPDDFGSYTLTPVTTYRDPFHGPLHRTLSRISEKSSNESATPAGSPAESENPIVVGGGCGDNTSVSDQEEPNYTTSEDNENAPSISSDLPENMAHPITNMGNPSFEDYQVGGAILASPVSSTLVSPKATEYTQVDPDTLEEDLDETNAEEIKTEERDFIPPEIPADFSNSISSANNNASHNNSEGSLHDSMEILEDVNTVDHFENDAKQEEEDEVVETDQNRYPPPSVSGNLSSLLPKVDSSGQLPEQQLAPAESMDRSEGSGRYVIREGSEELMF